MGGLGPGIGGFEILVIGVVALLVVGPKDLPLMMRKLGQAMARARAMANDFRASFDEMARQSELDELRKEVEALRRTQMVPLGAEAEATFREINADLNRPVEAPASPPLLVGPEEFADPGPSAVAVEPVAAATSPVKPRARAKTTGTAGKEAAPKTRAKAAAEPSRQAGSGAVAGAKAPGKPRVARTRAVDL